MKTLVFTLLTLTTLTHSQTAYEIVKKSEELHYATSSYIEMTMTIIKPTWQRTFGMKVWALEPDYALVYVTAPARDKGTVTLKRKNEIWNWLPTIQKTIKIPPSMMNQSWMGSDFTNDDLIRSSSYSEDYNHTILGKETVDGYVCYKIQSIPKPNVGIVWSKVISYIAIESYIHLKSEFYDEDNTLVKVFHGLHIREVDGRQIPTIWEMIPLDKENTKTIIEYHTIKFNIDITPSFFSQQNMTRVK
ncbi:MAG: outer membrane lipoprotein-sorting protein [Bacteroidetes bacterium]|nr:outer membrane lipoprotein-sorting protein [Bacteroidota bacterium]